MADNNYIAQRLAWDKEIKQNQKSKANELKERLHISVTAAKQTDEYKSWNADMLAKYANKIEELKTRLSDECQQLKRRELADYPIFMAIAEEIGYDATGKKTAINELDMIGEELKKFITIL